jgi:nucleotidyltransferase/DNA polymerase involved in DNA repair
MRPSSFGKARLVSQPVAVGGGSARVITTCNYEARAFGVRSAMPGFKARERPDLIFFPFASIFIERARQRFAKYFELRHSSSRSPSMRPSST